MASQELCKDASGESENNSLFSISPGELETFEYLKTYGMLSERDNFPKLAVQWCYKLVNCYTRCSLNQRVGITRSSPMAEVKQTFTAELSALLQSLLPQQRSSDEALLQSCIAKLAVLWLLSRIQKTLTDVVSPEASVPETQCSRQQCEAPLVDVSWINDCLPPVIVPSLSKDLPAVARAACEKWLASDQSTLREGGGLRDAMTLLLGALVSITSQENMTSSVE